mgnify:CR=1 FL=1
MLYNYIKEHYKEAEPIFFSDLEREDITKSALNQQLKKLCEKGLLQKYDTGVYFIPKKALLNSTIGPNADELGFVIRNFDFIESDKNLNHYDFYYESVVGDRVINAIPSYVKLETSLMSYAFPTEEK